MRRRLWYSLYVLDRLLALQLGRPPAIRDDDMVVPLPSRDYDPEATTENQNGFELDLLEGNYFLAVIEFSRIVGFVLRDLYSPRKANLREELLKTKALDQQLLEWKSNLPRNLRFDRGHTFDRREALKRQVSPTTCSQRWMGHAHCHSETCLPSNFITFEL